MIHRRREWRLLIALSLLVLAACSSRRTSAVTSCHEGSGGLSAVAVVDAGTAWAGGEVCTGGEAHVLVRQWDGSAWGNDIVGDPGGIFDLTLGAHGTVFALVGRSSGPTFIGRVTDSGSIVPVRQLPFAAYHLA